jgi:hypothetical protein
MVREVVAIGFETSIVQGRSKLQLEIGTHSFRRIQCDSPLTSEEAMQDWLRHSGLGSDGVDAFAGGKDGLLDGIRQR